MNTFALLLLTAVLLSSIAANATATSALNEGPDRALARNPLGRKMAAEELTRDAGTLVDHIIVDVGTLRRFGLIGEDIKHVDELMVETSCVTQERCSKKKLVCFKKCTDSVLGLEPSANKCRLACEKCVPNC